MVMMEEIPPPSFTCLMVMMEEIPPPSFTCFYGVMEEIPPPSFDYPCKFFMYIPFISSPSYSYL